MVKITHADLGIRDEDLARRVLARARTIAPCIDNFPEDSEERKDAIAILKGVIAELPAAGEARIRSVGRNGTNITLADIASAFDGDASISLRSLCGEVTTSGAEPLGSFPEDSLFERLWPSERYS